MVVKRPGLDFATVRPILEECKGPGGRIKLTQTFFVFERAPGPELGGGGLKRKGWFQSYGGAKYARTQGSSMGQPMVERQRIMTVNEAKATNVKLPPGYLYVPLDIPAQAEGGANGDGGAAGGEVGKKK